MAEVIAETADDADAEALIDAVYRFAAEQLGEGKAPQQVRALLVERGLSDEIAETVVSRLKTLRDEAMGDAYKASGRKNMGLGAAWCIGGTVLTMATMGDSGGHYVLFYGAIIGGAIQFIFGVFRYLQGAAKS